MQDKQVSVTSFDDFTVKVYDGLVHSGCGVHGQFGCIECNRDSFEFKQLRFNHYSNCNISQDNLAGKHLFTSGLSHCVNPRGAVNLRAAAQVR